MNINVTEQHIKDGCTRNSYFCPVARALKDAGLEEPSVSRAYIFFKKNGRLHEINSPLSVHRFIHLFDNGYTCVIEPFSFELNLDEAIDIHDLENRGPLEFKA